MSALVPRAPSAPVRTMDTRRRTLYAPAPRARRSPRGFTLLEVMIAVAILSLIGGLTYKSFDSAWDVKQRIEAAEEKDQMMRAALNRMAREISMAFTSEHYDHKRYRTKPTLFRLKDGRRSAQLLFTSFAHQRLHTDAKEGDQGVFEYTLANAEDGSGTQQVLRRSKAIIDEEIERGGDKQPLAEDVLEFSVQCWDAKDREWRDEWDSNSPTRQGQPALPPRVRLTLVFKDENGKEKKLSTQTKIFLTQPLDF